MKAAFVEAFTKGSGKACRELGRPQAEECAS